MSLVLPCAYLAPVSHYSALKREGTARLEVCDHYQKQTLRNRCEILSANGRLALTVPVVKPEGKTQMKDIRISDHGNWRHLHWNALRSAYMASPFYEFLADDFAPFYEKRYEFLADFNENLMRLTISLLGLNAKVTRTEQYVSAPQNIPSIPTSPYYQVFASRHGFQYNLSIVDLLFNMGNEAILYL